MGQPGIRVYVLDLFFCLQCSLLQSRTNDAMGQFGIHFFCLACSLLQLFGLKSNIMSVRNHLDDDSRARGRRLCQPRLFGYECGKTIWKVTYGDAMLAGRSTVSRMQCRSYLTDEGNTNVSKQGNGGSASDEQQGKSHLSNGTPANEGNLALKDAHKLGDKEPRHDRRCDDPCATEPERKTTDPWLISSSAVHHATGNADLLSDFKSEQGRFVQAADGAPMQVHGHGSVITDKVVLPDVCFVPALTANLVSVSQLIDLDFSVGFSRGVCYIRSGTDDTLVGKGHVREDGLFELDFLNVPLCM